ncbi:MAG: lamin tail domain-containing protein, partial [Planctomycetota bacterium]
MELQPVDGSILGEGNKVMPKFVERSLLSLVLIAFLSGLASAQFYITGDINGDRKVGWQDLNLLADRWLDPSCIAPACEADLDDVPGVNMFDVTVLAGNWDQDHSLITLVINEFMAENDRFVQDPNGDYHDWIEIYNYGEYAIDIGGMYLTDDVNDANQWYRIPDNCPEKTTIGPSSYLLVWADNELSEEGLHVDFGLDASGDEDLGLFDTDGSTLIDSIKDFSTNGEDNSYGRFPNGSGPWRVFFDDTNMPPTPGTSNGGDSDVDIVISEIMYHPYHSTYNPIEPEDIRAEYIELFNRESEDVNLAGWQITDGVNFVFPNGVTISTGGYLVVAADVNTFQAKYPSVTNVVGGWDGRLSNSGEDIELIDGRRVNIDRVRYADEGDWAVREEGPLDNYHRGWVWYDVHDGGGKSLELINSALPNEYGQNWGASLNDGGTPGTSNSVAYYDIAPMILDVKHRPFIPRPTDPVTVSARILDELATGITVTLHYRVDGDPGFITTTMFDDATHGDESAGDSVYTAQIPAYSNNTIIEFYLEALDIGSNSRTWPAPSLVDDIPEQVTNLLYQVDDSFDPNAIWVPGSQPIYRLIMTDAEWTELEYIGSHNPDAQTYAQMNATFISVDGVDIKLRYNVGVRNRGHGSRNDPPNNYRVNFPNDRSWKGVTAINLNTKYTYLQLVGNAIFRMSGLAQCETTAVQVRVNGQNLAVTNDEMYGSYVHVEVVDNDFTNNHYPDDEDGNAYKCMRKTHQADLRYEGTNPNPYRENYFKRTNVAEDDWSDLVELTYVLSNNTQDEIYVEEVNRVLNVEQWLRLIAVNTLLGNNETTLANGNGDDYYLYCGIVDPRFVMIQHDLDCIFGIGDNPDPSAATRSIFRATAIPAMKRFLEHPQFVPRYYWHLRDLIETTFSPERFGPFIDKLLGDYVPTSKIDQIKNFIPARNAHVLSLIPSEMTINSNLPQSYGYYVTDSNVAALNGTADSIETRSVLVNGRLAYWSGLDGTWSIGESTGMVVKEVTLVAEDDTKAVLVPTGPISDDWRSDPNFYDSNWIDYDSVPNRDGGVGYERGSGYGDDISYDVETEMYSNNATCYIRIPFTVDGNELAELNFMTLRMRYDDGFVAYINGDKVEGVYEPSPLLWNSETANNRSHEAGESFDEYPISKYISSLRPGENILAIHGLNISTTSSDFLISVELVVGTFDYDVEGFALNPGINRVIVQTFDEPNGTGNELEKDFIDIWYDDGDEVNLSILPPGDFVLDAASGPWHVTGDLVVPSGITLTIGPGTTLFFDTDRSITINGGRLLAEGSQYERIRLASVPGSGSGWMGLGFVNSLNDNRLSHIDMEFDGQSDSILVDHSQVLIDNMIWSGTYGTLIKLNHPSLIVRNSVFPGNVFGEMVQGEYIEADEYLILESNLFNYTVGDHDLIDFLGADRPGPILQVYNNIFLGGGDDGIDLDGTDAHIEGNIFTNFHLSTTRTTTSNAIATGKPQTGGLNRSEITVVRNVFSDVDHAVLLKEDCFMNAENNVFVGSTGAVIQFHEPNGTSVTGPGKGAYLDGNIFWNNNDLFYHLDEIDTNNLTVNRSIVSSVWHDFGVGNLDADPIFVDPNADWYLKSMSPAIGTGPWGLDMGAYVPGGACISGEPYEVTHRTSATFDVGGPGITHYKYCINDPNGPWSEERSVDVPIELTGLSDGYSYTVYAIGKNSAGVWQSEDSACASRTWTVDTAFWRLVINEVLARNVDAVDHNGTTPDMIELYYNGPAALDLADMSISDNPENPRKFIFPPGATIEPNEYLVLYADDNPVTPGIHLGFGLDGEGDEVYLYNNLSAGGEMLDSVEFGLQIPDLSIGRVGYNGRWTLTMPTIGQANIAQPLGDPAKLKINEWLTNCDMLTNNNFIELYNPHAFPVDLGGLYLTDEPVARPDKHEISPLSFVPGMCMAVFIADGDPKDGPTHLNFRLSADLEIIALFDADLDEIDKVIYGPQTTDVSQGRSPDGSDTYAFFEQPTPRVSNVDTMVISEALAHSHLYKGDWIELYNTTNEVIDIGGWFLSDNMGSRMKYEIAEGTTIESDNYIVFYEDVNFGNPNDPGCHVPFALSENGETVCLSSGLGGVLTGYIKIQEFGASQTGVSFGRYVTSTGMYDFVAMDHNTPKLPNADPKVGPVVINEIMYNPLTGNQKEEYIELYNTTGASVTLWRIDK